MRFAPHSYTVRDWDEDLEAEFDAFVQMIRDEGVLRYWPTHGKRREVNPQLDLDGLGYWTVGDPVGVCRVINRATLPDGEHPGTIPVEELERARELNALRGRRVRLIAHGRGARMRPAPGRRPHGYDERLLPAGIEGTVMMADTLDQLHVRWDNLTRSALRPGVDEWAWR